MISWFGSAPDILRFYSIFYKKQYFLRISEQLYVKNKQRFRDILEKTEQNHQKTLPKFSDIEFVLDRDCPDDFVIERSREKFLEEHSFIHQDLQKPASLDGAPGQDNSFDAAVPYSNQSEQRNI